MSEKIDTHELTINGKKCTAFAIADLHPDDLEKYQQEFYFWWGDMLKLRETVPDIINGWYRGHDYDKEAVAAIESDRIEVVTEHVEATVMDALQALVASGGKPVKGWKFGDGGGKQFDRNLAGSTPKSAWPFITDNGSWSHAYRPVTRVRIKPEAKPLNTREVPDGVKPLPVDKPWLAYVGFRSDGSPRIAKRGTWLWILSEYTGWGNGFASGTGDAHYAIDVRHPDARKHFPDICKAHDYSRVYGYTLDGNPVPTPPEGWEIVPEGELIGEDAKVYSVRGWVGSYQHWYCTAETSGPIRAYARRVVKESLTPEAPATAEESPWVGELEKAFDKYWNNGSKHRAIDAFRAGVKWAKEVRGE